MCDSHARSNNVYAANVAWYESVTCGRCCGAKSKKKRPTIITYIGPNILQKLVDCSLAFTHFIWNLWLIFYHVAKYYWITYDSARRQYGRAIRLSFSFSWPSEIQNEIESFAIILLHGTSIWKCMQTAEYLFNYMHAKRRLFFCKDELDVSLRRRDAARLIVVLLCKSNK